MKTSSQILNLLQKSGPLSVLQISQSIGLTKAAVRFQLQQLLAKNLISIAAPRPPTTAGRPAASYALITASNPLLTLRLLEIFTCEIMTMLTEVTMIDQVAENFANALLSTDEVKQSSKPMRISMQIAALSKFGFEIHWEIRQGGPEVSIETEPLSAVIPNDILVREILEAIKRKIG